MFQNFNSNFQYSKSFNKSSVPVEKNSALLKGLHKEYQLLHNENIKVTPVHARLFYLRKILATAVKVDF